MILIIICHRSAMPDIATDVTVPWSVRPSVCLSVCHTRALC